MSNIRLSKERVSLLASATISHIETKRNEYKQRAISKMKARRAKIRWVLRFLKDEITEAESALLKFRISCILSYDFEKAEQLLMLANNTQDGHVWVSAEDMAVIIKYAPKAELL